MSMTGEVETMRVQRALIDSLYTESMLLADEARAYFDVVGREQRDMLGAMDRVVFSCESLKVTTRLMHSIAWLLTQRAVAAGEIAPGDARDPSRRLGEAPVTDAAALEAMPVGAQHLIAASIDLHRRIARLDAAQDEVAGIPISPARSMLDRLAHAF
jgi:regulator of CtrA degradation